MRASMDEDYNAGIEKKLCAWGNELDDQTRRVEVLERVEEAIRDKVEDGVFTTEELRIVRQDLDAAAAKKQALTEAFRLRFSLYEEKIKRLTGLVKTRQEIIDRLCQETGLEQHADIMDLFAQQHIVLTGELEKSRVELDHC